MPIIIRLFRSIDLLDIPDKRKIHRVSTPTLGGIAIFLGLVFAILISSSFNQLASEKYLVGALTLIFLLGVRDDLSSLMAKHKLVVQVFAAFLIVSLGGVEISGLHGLFGIVDFPYGMNIPFTVFVIVVLTNAFNLIDGIDGLAGSIGLILSLFFGLIFYSVGDQTNGIICIALAGAIIGFLIFNWHPSKVFMGDTGSMTLGFLLSTAMIKFLNADVSIFLNVEITSTVALVVALFILPVFDTLRVFFVRFFQGKPPLAPDRNHIHHVLLKCGLNHSQTTILLISYNLIAVVFAITFQFLGNAILIASILGFSAVVITVLDLRVKKRQSARVARLSTDIKLTKSA